MEAQTMVAPAPATRIDEHSRRKPEFRDGVPITLADGREWVFPRPTMTFGEQVFEFRPIVGDDGALTFGDAQEPCASDFGPDYEDLLERFKSETNGWEQTILLLRLAYDLLSRNYDLKPVELSRLLPLRPGDEDNRVMWEAIAAVAQGHAPKPMASGSAPPA